MPPRRRRWEGEHGSVAEVGKVAGGERAGETVVRIDPKYFRPAEARRPVRAGPPQSRRLCERGYPGVSAHAVAVSNVCACRALECGMGGSAYALAVNVARSCPTISAAWYALGAMCARDIS